MMNSSGLCDADLQLGDLSSDVGLLDEADFSSDAPVVSHVVMTEERSSQLNDSEISECRQSSEQGVDGARASQPWKSSRGSHRRRTGCEEVHELRKKIKKLKGRRVNLKLVLELLQQRKETISSLEARLETCRTENLTLRGDMAKMDKELRSLRLRVRELLMARLSTEQRAADLESRAESETAKLLDMERQRSQELETRVLRAEALLNKRTSTAVELPSLDFA